MLADWQYPADTLWPFRPHPQPDELLSSLLIRIAEGLGLQTISLLNATWGTAKNLLHQDLDNYAPNEVEARVALALGLEREAIHQTTLVELEGRLCASYNTIGRNAWILPTTISNTSRRRHGLQYCPECLRTDAKPYFRRTWRLAWATVCAEHDCRLHDACPECGSVLHPHKAISLHRCHHCHSSLTRARDIACSAEASYQQRTFELALQTGWTALHGRWLYSHLYFQIVRQIACLLVNGKRADRLRTCTARLFGGNPAPFAKPTARQPIEYLRIEERTRLFQLVQSLLDDFPNKFVEACQAAELWRSHAIKDMAETPFALDQVLRTHLDGTRYKPTTEEVAAAARWLRQTKGYASYPDLKALCGESRLALYTHMDYQRRPCQPSKHRARALQLTGSAKAPPPRVAPHRDPAPAAPSSGE
jgi:hypothetical protein